MKPAKESPAPVEAPEVKPEDPVDRLANRLVSAIAKASAPQEFHVPPSDLPPDPKTRPTEAELLGLPWDARILSRHREKDGSKHVEYLVPGDLKKKRAVVKKAKAPDPEDDE